MAPPDPSPGREILEAFFTLFVGTVLQVGRAVNLVFLSGRRKAARRDLDEKAREMGRGMLRLSVGNELLRRKTQALEGGPPERSDEAVRELGHNGLETMVPLPGLEAEYERGQRSAEAAREAEGRYRETAGLIWPRSVIGWAGLVGSYALTAFLLFLLVRLVWLG